MDVIPKDIAFAVAKFEGWNCNNYRLETNGATSAAPNSIITLSLPSNAIIDLRSFKVHFDVATTADNPGGGAPAIYGKLPADTSSLIQQCEVYCGGVQICQGFSEFNTVSRVKKLIHSSRDREGSIDQTLYHGKLTVDDAIDQVTCIFKPNIGLFAESSSRYWPSNITSDMQIRITMAPNCVLAHKEHGRNINLDFSDGAVRARAPNVTYGVSSIHATIATVTLGDAYERMLMDRLAQEESLKINYKEYYTFSLHGTAGAAHDVRFSLSANSIDKLYLIMRDGNYQTAGIRTRQFTGAEFSDANSSNFLHFKSFNSSTTQRGNLQYQWSVNNVMHPVYRADALDAVHELLMCSDQHGHTGRGNMICSLQDWNVGKCIVPLQMCMPGQPINLMSGYNSRGNNTQFSVSIAGQDVPAANAASQVTDQVSSMVICETTAQLLIAGAKQISVAY